MTDLIWIEDDLAPIDRREDVRIASLRPDNTLTGSRIIWAVILWKGGCTSVRQPA